MYIVENESCQISAPLNHEKIMSYCSTYVLMYLLMYLVT